MADIIYNMNYGRQKKGGKKMSPRTGRPTDNPKKERITVRLDEEAREILENYCKQEECERAEAIRRGVKKLKDDIKK